MNYNEEIKDNEEMEQEKVYYCDEEYNIYDENLNLIGKMGADGYTPNYENNSLLKDGKQIGFLDIMPKTEENTQILNKPYAKRLIKPKETEKSAAFINIYGFICIIAIILFTIFFIMRIK